ncbi:DUF1837 domain-containing protein [Pseudarthrobacter sp. B4EP4b]|uniref:HamA C-terminal domain-containing protein n=1 Tax=Pseudarthrobacter sp. B4EP4b TaxID=2590664 RepID=UPI0015EF4D48|nr:DUF1837 domain-containing protein [Pseudarthrobacter sp. B4EP4b]
MTRPTNDRGGECIVVVFPSIAKSRSCANWGVVLSSVSAETDQEWVVEAFGRLARGDDSSFAHLLTAHADPVILEDSRTTVRTHFLAVDPNGQPVAQQLANTMGNALLDFAIPRDRIRSAWEHLQTTGATDQIVALQAEARDLLVRSDTSGEGGELLLFLLMERVLGYPQILSKMPLKTNNSMHVHGSDGVHAALRDDGILDLYWGESKLYENSTKAFTDCFESIAPFLDPERYDTRERDLLLVREHLNVDDEEIVAHLIRYFDEGYPESIQVRWNGVCLVGFDISSYPNVAVAVDTEFAKIAEQVERWHKAIRKRVADNNLLSVSIDVFCVPVPSVMKLRQAVRARVGAQ